MPPTLSDDQIQALLYLAKPLPPAWRTRLSLRTSPIVRSHRQRSLDVSVGEESFQIRCRQNSSNPVDFSIILVYRTRVGETYRLLRCNGRHPSRHTNRIEKGAGRSGHTFGPCFHIHRATQRYQDAGMAIDGYAEPTDAYNDYESALTEFMNICGFVAPDASEGGTPDMFEGRP